MRLEPKRQLPERSALKTKKVDLLVDITECDRCGEEHTGVLFSPLTNAAEPGQMWGMCSKLNEPLLAKKADLS